MTSTPTIAVLSSGTGSNLQILIDRAQCGDLGARIGWIASNNSRSGALERARIAGIPAHHVSTATEGSEEGVAKRLSALVEEQPLDCLVLAGYMRPLPERLLELLPNRVVNIHPALLPAFGGKGMFGNHIHEAVIRRGVQWSGVTVHLVTAHYDEGPILCQRIVPVHPQDDANSLGARVLALEHDTLWKVVRDLVQGHTHNQGGKAR